jgi:hypothetical protein
LPPSPPQPGRIETASHFGVGAGCACRMPIAIGPATTAIPATANATFLAKLSPIRFRFLIIASTLFFRFAPVTPATHLSGDSTYNLQTLRIPSA